MAPWLESAWATFAARLAADCLPHAILLGGPAGLGKRDFARAIEAALLCVTRRTDGHACGACRGCRLREAGSHPDMHRVSFALNEKGEPRSEIIVQQVRELGEVLVKTSQFGGYRVATIDPADALNPNSGNALLKTLEEPAPGAVLVLVTDRPSRLIATIRSRCARIDVRFPPRDAAHAWLQAQGIAPDASTAALDLAAGNPGIARRYADAEARALAGEVAKDLESIASGAAGCADVASRWAKDRAGERLELAGELARLGAWRNAGAPLPSSTPALARLTASADLFKLAAWWDRANLVRVQLSTPLRSDLLLFELLDEFRELAA
ncbi:MAG TPA: DNA polymerase III subunit delta' [Candidatus Saccharimonadia bacterium]|nr:DNA polymerase III subunit delta' [Candidatus Saccharimonadia bacterium]